jgi:hypothetical protein
MGSEPSRGCTGVTESVAGSCTSVVVRHTDVLLGTSAPACPQLTAVGLEVVDALGG